MARCWLIITMLNPLAVSFLSPGVVYSDILYGVIDRGYQLVKLDTDTLIGNEIGPIGYNMVGGIAFGNNGVLYGVTVTRDSLLEIDPETGAGTSIGSLGVPTSIASGLANDPLTDVLYGICPKYRANSVMLVTISKTDGAATVNA